MEQGFVAPQEEEEHEPAYNDEDEDEGDEDELTKPAAHESDEDELAVAEREYLNEMRTGMHITEEDGIAI